LNPSVELSIVQLIIHASLFTKVVLAILLSFSVISWGIMLQKRKFLKKYHEHIEKFLKLLTVQDDDSLEEACTAMSTGTAKTMPILIMKMDQYRRQGRKITAPDAIINNAVMHDLSLLNKDMNMLATAANLSPLIGLFGTVWGIMYAFINISQMGNASIETVAPGIAEALITTFGGLLVAIPAMAGHSLLTSSIHQCQDILDRVAEITHSLFGEQKQT
jgi:biopolymer transport protein TolQ